MDCTNSIFIDIINGCIKPCYSVAVKSTSFKPCRHFRRLMLTICLYPGSPREIRADIDPCPYIDTTSTLRSKQSLMPCKAKDIYTQFFHIYRKYSCSLRCIHYKEKVMLLCNFSNPFYIHKIACEIGACGSYNSLGIRINKSLKVLIVWPAKLISRHKGKPYTFITNLIKRTKHRVMLKAGRYNSITLFKQSLNYNV